MNFRTSLGLALLLACVQPPGPLCVRDRVVVVRGEHAGRHGTVTMIGDYMTARIVPGLTEGKVRIGLDGEDARGTIPGRGGIPIVVDLADVVRE